MKDYKILLFSLLFIIPACGYEELPMQNSTRTPVHQLKSAEVKTYKKKDIERYTYKGDKFKDPFIPLTGEGFTASGLSDEIAVPNIGNLTLRGIFAEGSNKMALISGGGTNYILKGSRLYDNRQRLVKGISGIIKSDSVIMIAPDKTTKEIKMMSK